MSPLTKKLGRDLWRIKGQAIAIGLVIAAGVLMQVMMTGLVASLDETRRTYYERYRLAEVFAPVTRAPQRLAGEIRGLPGVSAVEVRVRGSALIDLDGESLPIQAQVLSLPDYRETELNAIYLTDGRMIDGNRAGETIVLRSFAVAHDLKPGNTLNVTMNGFRRDLKIVGFAQSPEFLYTAAPGELISDDKRFAVLWVSRSTLEAAFDMEGAFNEAILSLSRGTETAPVIAAVDRILDRFGGLGAYDLGDMMSNRFVTEEIDGMRTMSKSVPPVFMAVAAFLLYIVISRMVQAEREEIGLMKAFGYTNGEVGIHYFQLIMVIALGGALTGCILGVIAGRAMVDFYLLYFKIPFLVFRLDPIAFVLGVGISVLSASAGGLLVLRRVFRLNPATAMRPAAPPDYSRSGKIGAKLSYFMDQPSRMVFRRITRQRGRMTGAVIGVAAGVALTAAMASILASFEDMMELSFSIVDRSDLSVTFIHPVEARTAYDLESLPGVIEVEPARVVPAILRNGLEQYHGSLNGFTAEPRLNRAVDSNSQPISLRQDGITLSTGLASILDVQPGQVLTIDVREGRRPMVDIPVVAISESLLGAPAYMEIDALNKLLSEPLRISGVFLRIDSNHADQIYRQLKDMPLVAGVSLKQDTMAALQTIMDQGAGSMRYIMALIAGIITFGVVYNAARVAQAEQSRDLASLRVLGFSRSEVAFVFLGELAVVTLVALPVGALLGYFLTFAVSEGFSTEIYQISASLNASSYGFAILVVVLSAIVSGWLVKRDIDRANLVSSLKTRE